MLPSVMLGKERDRLKSCVACKLVKYCNRTCQSEHWKSVSTVNLLTLIHDTCIFIIFLFLVQSHLYATHSYIHVPQSTKTSVSNVLQKFMMNLCSKNLLVCRCQANIQTRDRPQLRVLYSVVL